MDNHLHVLCKLDPEATDRWSPQQVVRRWITIYPSKTLKSNDEKLSGSLSKARRAIHGGSGRHRPRVDRFSHLRSVFTASGGAGG
ncbi:hypothetical protein Mal33_48810 [Rosistilla oblonga]|uniref:Transposase IS200 like protein n=1 Tax=Rosistilla oblonga TaxID=2527990 RepID=A0A518J0I2_9BACT|nr:hypothetical protein Mal33_48810 [Rosistilla oblonga]